MESTMTKDVKKVKKTFLQNIYHYLFVFFVVFLCYAVPISMHVYSNGGLSETSNTTYTLSNGDKTVVFQGMTHIALPSFYKKVGEELTEYRNNGYSIFLEGIGHSDDKKIRKGDPKYDDVIKQYTKLVDNSRLEYSKKILNTKYVTQYDAMPFYYSYDDSYIDFTTDELKASIDESLRQKKGDYSEKEKLKELYSDALGDHKDAYKKLLENESLFILSCNLDDFFLFTVVNDKIMPVVRELTNKPDLESDITMIARNKKISDAINYSLNKNIYIVYGARHFEGVLKNLEKYDPKWKIVSTSKKVVFRK